VAVNKHVTACDMADTGLPDGALDVAIFSLSLMGAEVVSYLTEAWRTLRLDGHLHIAEATRRFHGRTEEFQAVLRALGFDIVSCEDRDRFTFIRAIKSERALGEVAWRFGVGGIVPAV
jgi:hypothetical protein